MQGLIKLGIERLPEEAVEFYGNCLHILRTLRERWIQESNDDRGAIFKKSFSFGIQKLYIDAIMQVSCMQQISDVPTYLFPISR